MRILARVQGAMRTSSFGNTLWSGSSSLFVGAAGAATSAVLARGMTVQDFGTLALIISLCNMLADVSDLGLSSSIVRFGTERVAREDIPGVRTVVAIVLRLKLIVGAVVLALAALFLKPIVDFLFHHVDEHIGEYFLLSFGIVAMAIAANIFVPIYQSYQKFRALALLLNARALAKLLLVLCCVLMLSWTSLPIMIGVETCTVFLLLILSYKYSPLKRLAFDARDKGLQRKILSFNKWISLYQAITLIGGRLDLAFVGGFSDAHALGIYGAATKVSGLVSVLGGSYMSVLLAEVSASLSPEGLRRTRRHAVVMVCGMIAMIGLLAALADPVVLLLFGRNYPDAVPVVRVMCAGLALTVAAYPINATLFALNRSSVFPVVSGLAMIAFAAGNLYLVPAYGPLGAGMAFSLSGAIAFVSSVVFYAATGPRKP